LTLLHGLLCGKGQYMRVGGAQCPNARRGRSSDGLTNFWLVYNIVSDRELLFRRGAIKATADWGAIATSFAVRRRWTGGGWCRPWCSSVARGGRHVNVGVLEVVVGGICKSKRTGKRVRGLVNVLSWWQIADKLAFSRKTESVRREEKSLLAARELLLGVEGSGEGHDGREKLRARDSTHQERAPNGRQPPDVELSRARNS
jgi:hypothetical protein